MVGKWSERLRGLHVGKAAVVPALVVSSAYLVIRLLEGAAFFGIVMRALAMAFGFMVVIATALKYWRGDDVEEAEIAGQRLRFGRARKAVGVLEQRVDAQMTAINQRLYDLETRVFKDKADG